MQKNSFLSSFLWKLVYLRNYESQKKMLETKNVYLDNIYNFCLEHFIKFCILAEINSKNHDFYRFLWFHHENSLVAKFHYHIRNHPVKIHKYIVSNSSEVLAFRNLIRNYYYYYYYY